MSELIGKAPSQTFSEFLLLPNLTEKKHIADNVDLKTPLVKFKRNKKSILQLNTPLVSAAMQAVSGSELAIALARQGGLSFIYCSQPIEKQAEMIRKVKKFKAGFVISDSNLRPVDTISDAVDLIEKTGHSTIAVTDDGSPSGKLMGVLTSRDYRLDKCDWKEKIAKFMTSLPSLVYAKEGIDLEKANDLIWAHKLNSLPIISKSGKLKYLVFRKDYNEHRANPYELVDNKKRLMAGAAINTWDYRERAPALIEAEADILCLDSSDGFNWWQKEALWFIKKEYSSKVLVGAGNIVDQKAFQYLAEAGADFVKIGIGGGSICITREQKGIGRGQPSALTEVARARDKYFSKTGTYIPLCADGGVGQDYHINLALAMGADFVMMGRWFARFDESPGQIINFKGNYVKEYWGEGSERARNWQRYSERSRGSKKELQFEEGVDAYVPYAGRLDKNIKKIVGKIKSTMCNCGVSTIKEFHKKARLVSVSPAAIQEGSAHNVIIKQMEGVLEKD